MFARAARGVVSDGLGLVCNGDDAGHVLRDFLVPLSYVSGVLPH